jgi:hypothetical protein
MTRYLAAALLLLMFTASAQARPRGCPALWCACWLSIEYGYSVAQAKTLGLFKARNWASFFQRATLAPGNVAIFARGRGGGHVGRIDGVRPGEVLLTSGNDGGAVRTRWRSTRGLIAVVDPRLKIKTYAVFINKDNVY